MNSAFTPFLTEALAHADAMAARAKADNEAAQQQEHERREQVKTEILKDLTSLHPQFATFADYLEVERLSCDGANYPTGAGLLMRFPDCDLIYLSVHRFTKNNPWQTIPGKEDPFKVYPDIESWWEEHGSPHRTLLSAIADAHRRYQAYQKEQQQEAPTPVTDPAEAEITEDYLKTLRALDAAGHPVPLSTTLADHIKGLLRRLSQYELLLMRGNCHERSSASR